MSERPREIQKAMIIGITDIRAIDIAVRMLVRPSTDMAAYNVTSTQQKETRNAVGKYSMNLSLKGFTPVSP